MRMTSVVHKDSERQAHAQERQAARNRNQMSPSPAQ
jgi:hypothetical protein